MKTLSCVRATLRSSLILLAAWGPALAGCTGAPEVSIQTPLPGESRPAALSQARQAQTETPEPGPATPLPSQNRPALPTEGGPASASAIPFHGGFPTDSPASRGMTPSLPSPPTSTPLPPAKGGVVQILSPGPLSKVTSPLHLQASILPSQGGQVQVELLGEDGRVLTREILALRSHNQEGFTGLAMDLEFEVAAAAEAGRLKISLDDAHGRITALNSVPLTLLSHGKPDILAPEGLPGPILLQQPSPRSHVQGGKLLVSGLARPASGQPLMVRLLTAEGSQLGHRLAGVSAAPEGEYGRFSVEVPYSVRTTTEALLVVWEGGSAIQDIIYLTSLVVRLSP